MSKTSTRMKAFITDAIFKEHRIASSFENDFDVIIKIEDGHSLKVQRADDQVYTTSLWGGNTAHQPSMAFEIGVDLKWRPVALTSALMGKREAIIYCEGKRWVDPAEMRYLNEFSQDWARDLKNRKTVVAPDGSRSGRSDTDDQNAQN